MVEKNYWKMSPGAYAYLKDEFIKNNIIALGPNRTGDISKFSDDEIKGVYRKSYNERGTFYLQLIQFLRKFQIDDKVLLYGKKSILALGKIKGKYEFNSKYSYHHTRSTEWDITFDFDEYPISGFNIDLQNKLMRIKTIIKLSDEEWNEIEYYIP